MKKKAHVSNGEQKFWKNGKTITSKNSIKIYGNPNLKINKKIVKNYLKDHILFMAM